MEGLKNSRSNSFDYSVISDLDLTNQLRDKIRSQAQRLRGLEQYRLLCEEFIQELMPNHPLPITKEHLRSNSSIIKDLHQSKEKIKSLEFQLSSNNKENLQKTEETKEKVHESEDYLVLLEKYNDLLQDKTDLEESLRSEMLNCEEQRTYIEYLKESLKSKIESFDGLLIDHKSMYSQNFDVEASKRQQIKLQRTVLDYESRFKTVQNQLKTKDNENEALMCEREQIDFHLQQAAEALMIAEEEVSKLESEKNTLMGYMEEHSVKEKEMQKELNDLSRYFEEMKKDYHSSLAVLEENKGSHERLEKENEELKEKIQKLEKLLNEKKEIIEKIKENLDDKDKKNQSLKEEKNNLETKIEKLQSNVGSLTESLKDLQIASSSLQENLDFSNKQDICKSDTLNKLKLENASLSQEILSVTEKINELEKEKRSKFELERMRELDIRQIQEFKSKLADIQEKCGKLKNFKEKHSLLDQIHKADMVKISKLEEKLSYLNQNLKDYEYKDLVSDKNLNDLEAENSTLIKEINEACDKNQKILAELERRNKVIESFKIKVNHLNEYCNSLESEKASFERIFEEEKSKIQEKHEQILADQAKIEELEKLLQNSRKHKENAENLITLKQEKLKSLKQRLKTTEKNLENEQKTNQKLNFDIKEHLKLLETKDYELEKLKTAIASFCKTISAFCGKFTIVYNDYRSCISTKYKEFLNNWKEGGLSNIESISSWIGVTIEEIEFISKLLFSSKKDLETTTFERKNNEAQGFEENYWKTQNFKLKSEVDELYSKIEKLKSQWENESKQSEFEILTLKTELNSLKTEKYSLIDSFKSLESEYQAFKLTQHKTQHKELNNKSNFFIENKTLSANTSMSNARAEETNKILKEISRLQSELERSKREKFYLEGWKAKMDKDNKKKGSDEYSNISSQIKEIDKNIKHYNTSILLLKDDLALEEKTQVLRGKNREKIISLDFSAARPFMHSASSEKNLFSKEKSHF